VKGPKNSSRSIIDPICGMEVDPNLSDLVSTHKGQLYYFCAEGCRQAFEKNPQKYLKGNSPKRKGWWGRYLDRLNKTTEGKSMKCH